MRNFHDVILVVLASLCSYLAHAKDYPREWWIDIPRHEAAAWEILPQDAKPGEVILSKRTELGILSKPLEG
jgi:hypothetical protein